MILRRFFAAQAQIFKLGLLLLRFNRIDGHIAQRVTKNFVLNVGDFCNLSFVPDYFCMYVNYG